MDTSKAPRHTTERNRTRAYAVTSFKFYRNRNASVYCDACTWSPPIKMPRRYNIMHVHHIVPVAAGGGDEDGNLILLCPTCHCLAHRLGALSRKGAVPRTWTGPRTRADLLDGIGALLSQCGRGDK